MAGLVVVGPAKTVVVEGHAVDGRDEEERPMRAALCLLYVAVVVYRQEDVGNFFEIGEGLLDILKVWVLHQQERHARPEQDNARLWVLGKDLAFKPFLPEGNILPRVLVTVRASG